MTNIYFIEPLIFVFMMFGGQKASLYCKQLVFMT